MSIASSSEVVLCFDFMLHSHEIPPVSVLNFLTCSPIPFYNDPADNETLTAINQSKGGLHEKINVVHYGVCSRFWFIRYGFFGGL